MASGVDLIKKLQVIQELPPSLHWFCPRDGPEDSRNFFDDDLQGENRADDDDEKIKQRSNAIVDAKSRTSTVLDALQIFAFDGPDAAPYQDWLRSRLAHQMKQCDVCVREFHRARKLLKQKLEDNYDEDDVRAFLQKFDDINRDRIRHGLIHAGEQLKAVAPAERRVGVLDATSLYAVFEALNCEPVYSDDAFLSECFDEPFLLLQTKKLLRLNNYTPAMTSFLFDTVHVRKNWAQRSWFKFQRKPTTTEFEFTVCAPLFVAMIRVQINNLDLDFLPRFWTGARIIVEKLDKELITHSLRAMEADICKLALEHLQVDTPAFSDLLVTMKHVLLVSPKDFWEAMGSIAPTVWIDQFFNSQALESMTKTAGKEKTSDSIMLDDLFSWLVPFVRSIKAVNQPTTCRPAVNLLLGHFQQDHYPQVIKTYCVKLAFKLLGTMLSSLNGVSLGGCGVTTSEAFEIVTEHSERIVSLARNGSSVIEESAEVLRQFWTLDCKCLAESAHLLVSDSDIQAASILVHDILWKKSIKCLGSGNVEVARGLLLSTRGLAGIEKAVVTPGLKKTAEWKQFNNVFDTVSACISDMLERVTEFRLGDLESIFSDSETTRATVMLLFLSSDRVRSAALEMIKNVRGHTARNDTLESLLKWRTVDTLEAFAASFRQISRKKKFASASSMLKITTDILNALCNSTNGILRQSKLSQEELAAVYRFWQFLWQALTTIFGYTETWSIQGHDKHTLMDFCRDTMEFAEKLFNEFGVFKGALTGNGGASVRGSETTGMQLMEQPKIAMNDIVKWLKLRDEYLVARSCSLVCMLLDRLKEFETDLSGESLEFPVKVLSGQVRTVLNAQQKARLQRAVEAHLDEPFETSQTSGEQRQHITKAKQTKLGIDMDKWKANANSATPSDINNSRQEVLNTATKSVQAYQALQAARQAEKEKLAKPSTAAKPTDSRAFLKKRELEREEKKKRDARTIADARKRAGLPTEAGSGLSGLGVVGKDHSQPPKGSGVMLSSDEDSDDDDSEDEQEASKGANGKPTGQPKNTGNVLRAPPKPQGPVKKRRLVRSARDMRARLAPDLSPLHQKLLSWEYFYDGAYPPNTSTDDYFSVLSSFRDPISYRNTFLPLLILEAWNGFLKAREEVTSKTYEFKVLNRTSVDAFIEISTTMASPAKDKEGVSEGDIVLLAKSKHSNMETSEPHCLSRIIRVLRKKNHVEVLYRAMPGTSLNSSLTPDANLYGLKIMSVIPLEREYGALQGLEYYDLCTEIAEAKPSPLLKYSDEKLQPFMQNYGLNKAQAKATQSAIDNDAFTLVQGPPGSGKTKTIVAIVSALLSHRLRNATGNSNAPIDSPSQLPRKLLVCAPSNAAVDELVMRFKEGVKTDNGELRKISVVRIGRTEAINSNVHDVTLEELVNKKLNINAQGNGKTNEVQTLMNEHKDVSEKLRQARANLDEAENKGQAAKELREEMDSLKRKKALLGQQVDSAKDQEQSQNRQADINRRRAQQGIIDGAHIICATLSGSGHEMFQSLNVEFESVIIDEAAQCVELSCLIPLKYGCAKCVLVGDPQQLPPTVFSREAARFKYEQSLFVRMQANDPENVHLLDTQYRMHPSISAFPSQTFYNSRLLDGPNMASQRKRPWHATTLLSPFRFFDVEGQQRAAPRGHSLVNDAEIEVAMDLYNRFTTDFEQCDIDGKIGVITPYKSQLNQLKISFRQRFGHSIIDKVEFNTTDAFQGRESEIIIFSCVRASPSGGIGFLQDIRRMNVGLTRAKSSLWVLGNSQSLQRGEYWAKMLAYARSTHSYTDGDITTLLRKPLKRIDKALQDSSSNHLNSAQTLNRTTASNFNDVNMDRVVITQKVPREKMLSADTVGSSAGDSRGWKRKTPADEDEDVDMMDASATSAQPAQQKPAVPTVLAERAKQNGHLGQQSASGNTVEPSKPRRPAKPPSVFIPKKKSKPQ